MLNGKVSGDGEVVDCKFKGGKAGQKQVCEVDAKGLMGPGKPCTNSSNYGFRTGQPCMAIKLNRVRNPRQLIYTVE